MALERREFLTRAGALAAVGALGAFDCGRAYADISASQPAAADTLPDWEAVRAQFRLSPDRIHMSTMLLSSHPKAVREAIETHRDGLDANPVEYLEQNNSRLIRDARDAAGRYLGISGSNIALTDSTTMGVGLVYNGLRLNPDHEILTTEQDYYVTHEALRQASRRTGATVKKIQLYEEIGNVTEDELVQRVAEAISPSTRVLAVTWVHSSTGLKLPIRLIAEALEEVNRDRDEASRVLFCVDGVHAFGCEDVGFDDLGCDFLMAGCHKWLFGPRGTGMIAGTLRGWASVTPSIPSFIDGGSWDAWMYGKDLESPTTADRMTPGGFKAFEHQWALPEAFGFHEHIGRPAVAERTRELAGMLKEGLAEISRVVLRTPRSGSLSAGIVSFDIDGLEAPAVVRMLRDRGIVASVAPYLTAHVRLTPSIRNTSEEIDVALREIRGIVS
ncbi:aminotransferase class V-fold PLP-dependent enzyme (plasmid) [Skermanella sp. TT6]|uniref:Aminotransferase class V-fold PLP-dependent enzyme n=1 Tax=Skermanella cutis TaxID=2775420 RepID=A0ABX7BFM7_9PROT|nr:aminotransferase class V-fold PLP-dependent enzyme [Skermanella sp. TT6]QQP92997.1 aminotransferase class V-fold PLP-dependent enzyme [Skermanella sp. TT6]